MNDLTVEGILGTGGALAQAMPGFIPRAGQVQMALAVEQALTQKRNLLVEAGTGTGKTLAYLVPAILSGLRVVVSTATRTLQDQLWTKDVPLLTERLGLSVTAAFLKGRANYLCLNRFERFDAFPLFVRPGDARHWPELRAWAMATKSGDRADSELPDGWASWSQVSTTSDNCLGSRCPQFEQCFVTRARREAEKSDLVIVNHALYFADLALRSRTNDESIRIVPKHDAVIFDEAHALEDVAVTHFSKTVSSAQVNLLVTEGLKQLAASDSPKHAMVPHLLTVKTAADALFKEAWTAFSLDADKHVRIDNGTLFPLQPELQNLDQSLRGLLALEAETPDEATALILRRASELSTGLDALLDIDSHSQVAWIEGRIRGLAFQVAPIEISQSLQSTLYSQVDAVVLTSATLQVDDGKSSDRFEFARRRFGFDAARGEVLSVASPFSFSTQAALYTPTRLPQPNDTQFLEALCLEIEALVQLTQGRAFLLFTSLKALDDVFERVAPRLGLPVHKQGERPKAALLKDFVAEPSVLFGSQSFWEGVDIPGEALSLVVIDKLPFEPPHLPRQAARLEVLTRAGLNAFDSYQVPQAALRLRQGFGRLIRTTSDRGIVAILDSRLTQKRYGQAFLRSLPDAKRCLSFETLREWWTAST